MSKVKSLEIQTLYDVGKIGYVVKKGKYYLADKKVGGKRWKISKFPIASLKNLKAIAKSWLKCRYQIIENKRRFQRLGKALGKVKKDWEND